jgi:hypothetical protein
LDAKGCRCGEYGIIMTYMGVYEPKRVRQNDPTTDMREPGRVAKVLPTELKTPLSGPPTST